MIQNANLCKINMNSSNNNNNNIDHSNPVKKNGIPKTFRQTDSTIRKLPSISYMLISEQAANKKNSEMESPTETKHVETAEIKKKTRMIKGDMFHSSPPLSPITIESTTQPSNYEFRIPTSHQRTSSLDSLMNAAENLERIDQNLPHKIVSLQRMQNTLSENVNILERKYCGNVSQNLTPLREEEIYETLRNLQKLSLELHALVTDILEAKGREFVTKQQHISRTSPTKNINLSTIDLPQPRLTLLPPLILKEGSQTGQNLTDFRFPDIKPSFLPPNDNNSNLERKIIAEKESYNAFPSSTTMEQDLQYRPPVFNKNNTLLQTPRKKGYSDVTGNHDISSVQSNLVVANPFNKYGNSFTLFPKNNNGKSTIITPVSQDKYHLPPNSKGHGSKMFIPPLNYEPEMVKLTPKALKEENTIFSDTTMQGENEPTFDIPYNVKRIKRESTTTKNSTPRKRVPIGITTTLKLTNKSLLEKSIKKYKQNEKSEPGETFSLPREPYVVGKHFENKGPIMQIQDMGGKESKKKLREEEEEGEEEERNKKCFHCQSSKTPEWRAGPYGGENICNACGLFYRKIVSKFGEKGGNLLMKYRQLVCPTNRRVPPYIEIPEEYMIKFSKESGFDQFSS